MIADAGQMSYIHDFMPVLSPQRVCSRAGTAKKNTQRRFYTQRPLHRGIYTEQLLHRRFCTQTLLHTEAFTQKSLF